MLKQEKEYKEEYGNIPSSNLERLDYLINNISIKNKDIYYEIERVKSINWKKESFIIYLLPKATPRPRMGRGGIFYVKGAKDNKKLFQKYITDFDIPLITTPIKFTCISYFPIPSSMKSYEKVLAELGFIRPISKPDFDNLAKAYCDMLQDTLIYDDALVVEGISKKYYSVKPRIEITIEYMEDYDSEFNKKKIIKKGK